MFRRRSFVAAFAAVFLVVLTALGGCAKSEDSSATTTTAGTTTAATSTTASGSGSSPVIDTFHIEGDVSCTAGQTVAVKATWTTQHATKTKIEVGGKWQLENQPPNGSAEVKLDCKAETHRVVLEAEGTGTPASVAHDVKTEPGTHTGTKPIVRTITLTPEGCQGQNGTVKATYTTENATTVEFEVDGQAPGAKAGLPTSGSTNLTVPCDGKGHSIAILAAGPGGKASVVRHVPPLS